MAVVSQDKFHTLNMLNESSVVRCFTYMKWKELYSVQCWNIIDTGSFPEDPNDPDTEERTAGHSCNCQQEPEQENPEGDPEQGDDPPSQDNTHSPQPEVNNNSTGEPLNTILITFYCMNLVILLE